MYKEPWTYSENSKNQFHVHDAWKALGKPENITSVGQSIP